MKSGKTSIRCGEIVWAKMRGYTWWPARLISTIKREAINKTLVRVDFLDDNTHALLAIDKVIQYKEGKESFRKTKIKRLLRAIRIADLLTSPNNNPELKGFTDNFSIKIESFGNDTLYNTIQEEVIEKEDKKDMDEKSEVKSSTIASIKTLLKVITVKKNTKLISDTENDALIALKAIQKSGARLIKDDIKELLKTFIDMYEDAKELMRIVSYAKEVLDSLEEVVTDKCFGEDSKNKDFPVKRKKIETIEIKDQPIPEIIQHTNHPVNQNKILVEENMVKEDVKKKMVKERLKGKHKSTRDEISPVVRDTVLMIDTCQRLAKVIEEVN